MGNQFFNQNNNTSEVEMWANYTNRLDSEQDKELFKKMLTEYYNYISIVVSANKQYFPSELLVIALILSQYMKMINWLMHKVSARNNNC
jgi:hypothetical protein